MKKPPRITCPTCKTIRHMEFECIDCCLRWLKPMTAEELRINTPAIAVAAGDAQLQAVRNAYKAAGMVPQREFEQQRKG